MKYELVKNEYELIKNELDVVLLPKRKIPNIDSVIHDELEDLAVVYCFIENKGQKQVIEMLQKDVLTLLCVDECQVKKDAIENAINKHKMLVSSIGCIISEIYNLDLDDIPMYVATTSDAQFGSKVLAYPEFLDYAATLIGGSYYILPSSVHELILLKDDNITSSAELKNIVKEVNETEVSPDAYLSDEVYRYDINTKKFEKASTYYNRLKKLS